MSKPKFVFVTKDFSGLGFAKHFQEEGCEVLLAYRMKDGEEEPQKYELVGDGIVEKIELDELMEIREDYKDWYWIFDGNHYWEDGELLREEGFKVFGGSELTYKMENDRKFGADLVKKVGLDTPPTHEFTSIQDGLDFLDENPDKAFVFKPDAGEGGWTTYVPDNDFPDHANRELYRYMESLGENGDTYILQERIDGMEYNVEIWVYKGKPFFAFVGLESKRKLNKDEGEMVGCAHDIDFIVPLESKIVQDTVMKLLPEFQDYTGFLDMNILVKDKKNYFLEFCARFGYNAHPNLFWNLAINDQSEIMRKFMDGEIDNFYDNFKGGFGASITLYIDHPKEGFPFEKEEHLHGHFYHFDTYRQDEEYYLAGYANEVGIVCAFGFTIKEAAKECLRIADKIKYPCHAMRSDLGENDYPSAPQGRYDALDAMGYLDKVEKPSEVEKLVDELYGQET